MKRLNSRASTTTYWIFNFKLKEEFQKLHNIDFSRTFYNLKLITFSQFILI